MGSLAENFTNGSTLENLYTYQNENGLPFFNWLVAIFLILTGIVSLILNGGFLVVYVARKSLHTPTNLFVASMACSMLLMSIVANPLVTISSLCNRWMFGDIGCTVEGFSVYFLGLTNMYSLCAISVDRYIIICKPRTLHQMTMTKAIVNISICWLLGLFWASMPLLGWNHYELEKVPLSCSVVWNSDRLVDISYVVTIFFTCFLFPLGTMLYCYSCIMATVRNVARSGVWDMTSRVARKNLRVEKKMAKTIAYMILVYLVAWSPYTFVSFWSSFGAPESVPLVLTGFPQVFAKSSCMFNPVVYIATNKQFRMAFYELLPEGLRKSMIKREEDAMKSSSDSDDKKVDATKGTQVAPIDDNSQGMSQAEKTVVEDLSPPASKAT